ncbi:MAG: cupin domain-containing protein [Desulfobacteraceae bacterium]|nr:cupin domain-containing protein [Desulfobacteraceae bacterium]
MEIVHYTSCEDVKIDQFPYRGKMHDVIGTSIRWLSKYGDDGTGYPDYGLRFFTIQPGGQIPIHSHFYHQTMYILTGNLECYAYNAESDELQNTTKCGPGSSIFAPSMEPHGMKNIGEEPVTFLCCICNVYDKEDSL